MGLGPLAFWKRGRANAPHIWNEETVTLFLQGGGRFSPRDFVRLDRTSQEAVASVGRAFLADLIATLAQAIHNPDFASQLGATTDAGAKREGDLMTAALGMVGQKIHGGRR